MKLAHLATAGFKKQLCFVAAQVHTVEEKHSIRFLYVSFILM